MTRPARHEGAARRPAGALLAFLVLGTLLGLGRPARGDLLQDVGASYQRVAEDLAAAFPKVEVHVTAVSADGVRVEGPGVEALHPGLELTVFRRGEMFRHPITNQPLGHTEQVLGTLVVTRQESGAAIGRLVPSAGPGIPAPAPGDGARITAGRLPVAVLPTAGVQAAFDSADQTRLLLVARFSAILDKTGRFLSVDPQRVLDQLGPPTSATPSPVELARRLGGVAVVTSRVVREGSARVLEATWISGQTGETLVSVRTPVTPTSFPPRFAWEETPELERKYPLDGPVRALALGDLDGDGRAELFVADEQTVTVYRTAEGGAPTAVENAAFRAGGLVLSVDIAPVTDSGRTQLIVVDQRGEGRQGIRARVLEWTGSDGYRVLYDTSGRYLRVVRVGAERWLLEQDAGEDEPFEPDIRRLVWDGERFREASRLRVPRGVSVYGLALMRLTGGADPEVVAFTDDYRLTVWTAKGQRLWTSADPLGGSAVTFEYIPLGAARRQAGGDTIVARIAGRVVPLAMPGAPSPEILVYENLLPALQQGRGVLPRLAATLFNRGRIHRLRWKDGAFVRVWQSGVTEGYIADFAYGDLDGDGLAEVVVGVVPRGFDLDTLSPLGRPRGRILAYELP
jgi:hypothetical protein